jgi:hypothetical protein
MWWAPNNASKQQMGFNSTFKGLMLYDKKLSQFVSNEVLAAARLKSTFWGTIMRHRLSSYGFEGTFCLHFQMLRARRTLKIKTLYFFKISETAYRVDHHRGREKRISQLLFSLVNEPRGEEWTWSSRSTKQDHKTPNCKIWPTVCNEIIYKTVTEVRRHVPGTENISDACVCWMYLRVFSWSFMLPFLDRRGVGLLEYSSDMDRGTHCRTEHLIL